MNYRNRGTGNSLLQRDKFAMIKRVVAVMMPFGGLCQDKDSEETKREVRTHQRACELEFYRIKHIVEDLCKIKPRDAKIDNTITYDVQQFCAVVGDIPRGALTLIRDADVLICLLTEKNVNVIYELAVRNFIRDVPIMIVKGNPDDVKPVYLKSHAHITYHPGSNNEVALRIEKIAADAIPEEITELPESLREVIDRHDAVLKKHLRDALTTKEQDTAPRRPNLLTELIPDPGEYLSGWDKDYSPYSVVTIPWKGLKQPDRAYTPKDLNESVEDIRVTQWNQAFLDLFSLSTSNAHRQTLNMDHLLDFLEHLGSLNAADRAAFELDQKKVMKRVVFNKATRNASASVPLRIGRHENKNFERRLLLPTIIARRVIGDPRQAHTMELIVSYVDITDIDMHNRPRRIRTN